MSGNRSDPSPAPRSKRRFVAFGALAAILLAVGVAVMLTVAGRQTPRAVETAGEPLTPQEIAEVKAAVEKQTGMPVRHVGLNRNGVVDVFAGGPGRAAYRVKKTADGWRVVEMFLAFSA